MDENIHTRSVGGGSAKALGLAAALIVLDLIALGVALGLFPVAGLDKAWAGQPVSNAPRIDAALAFHPVESSPTLSPSKTASPSPSPIPSATLAVTQTRAPARAEVATLAVSPTAAPSSTAAGEGKTARANENAPLPESAQIKGLYGVKQSLALSCESRSAVDWARFFGYQLDELEFQHALPRSDNPEAGFVGDPDGAWGQIPPHPYGVHAGPVADLLVRQGVPARAYRGLAFDDLRREIAAGRPVIVWVIGGVWPGEPAIYTAADGQTVTVAAQEHTVMLAGYTPYAVVIQDGSYRYYVLIERFRDSWGVLGNMAILEK